MKNERGYTTGELLVCLFGVCVNIAAVGGWIANISKVVATVADPITGMFVLRCVGIVVAPLGVVLGYF